MKVDLFPVRAAFTDESGRLTFEAVQFIKRLWQRQGGTESPSTSDLEFIAMLAQFQAGDAEAAKEIESLKMDAAPDLSATVAELEKQVEELKAQIANVSDNSAQMAEAKKYAQELETKSLLNENSRDWTGAIADLERRIELVPDYSAALAEANKTLKTLGTMATQNANAVSITGGEIDGTAIGGGTKAAGAFTTLSASGLTDLSASGAGQIKFPSTQNPSTNANTLDDYREGTWTPSLLFGIGNTGMTGTFSGTYTKIGRFVILRFEIALTAKGSSVGEVSITGIPFSAASLNAFPVYLYSGFAATYKVGIAYINGSTINEIAVNGSAAFTNSQFTDTSRLWATVVYQV